MKPEQKAVNELLGQLAKLASREWEADEIAHCLDRALPAIPHSVRQALTGIAIQKFEENTGRAPSIIASFASILLGDYDETPLTLSEWREIRDLVADGADELDMDIVTYAMSLVMDYGAF
ncbi:MAG: hypothetical protein QHH01_07085 [Spirochaetales bacterium]|nr:hypothetical protein [Spirochaetales bacterium]